MDGTLLGDEGRVSPRNLAALRAAQAAGIEIVVATGRRHSYAMHVLRPLGLEPASVLISSNGTVTRTLGRTPTAAKPCPRNSSPAPTSRAPRRSGSVATSMSSATPWSSPSTASAPTATTFAAPWSSSTSTSSTPASAAGWPPTNPTSPTSIRLKAPSSPMAMQRPASDAPIQAMLCGTVERMRRAEARLLEHPGVIASGHPSGRSGRTMNGVGETSSGGPRITSEMWDSSHQSPGSPSFAASSQGVGSKDYEPESEPAPILALNRTDYPGRDLSILDILPAGCSKGAALLSLAATRGIDAGADPRHRRQLERRLHARSRRRAVLMDNAPEDLKVLARARGWRIGPSNSDDGVAQAIEAALAVACLAAFLYVLVVILSDKFVGCHPERSRRLRRILSRFGPQRPHPQSPSAASHRSRQTRRSTGSPPHRLAAAPAQSPPQSRPRQHTAPIRVHARATPPPRSPDAAARRPESPPT